MKKTNKEIEKRRVELKKTLVTISKGRVNKFVGYSDDYELFEFLDSNRDTDKKKIDKLAGTFEDTDGNISPVVVNKNFVILDGQNRFEASKKAKLEVFFIIHDDPSLEATDVVKVMNTTQKNWNIHNFFEHYSKEGVKGYVEGIKLIAKHEIDLSALERFLPVGNSMIKDGIPFDMPEDIEEKIEIAIKIKEAEKKVLTNSRRLYKWASAMKMLDNVVSTRIEQSGKNSLIEKEWKKRGYDCIVKNLPHVIRISTSGDGTEELAALLSKAFDYRRTEKFEFVRSN